jgi:hypothetical protein
VQSIAHRPPSLKGCIEGVLHGVSVYSPQSDLEALTSRLPDHNQGSRMREPNAVDLMPLLNARLQGEGEEGEDPMVHRSMSSAQSVQEPQGGYLKARGEVSGAMPAIRPMMMGEGRQISRTQSSLRSFT